MKMKACVLIATRNSHKVDEIRAILGTEVRCLSLRDLPKAPEIDESGTTFDSNAILKAEGLATWLLQQSPAPSEGVALPTWVLSDDSGLEVDALRGAPGVLSARFASAEFGLSGNAPDAANNAKLLRLLALVPAEQRTARFRCVLALTPVASHPRQPSRTFDGTCEGRIGFVQRGSHGFGYDPLFIPAGFTESLAQLGEATKNRISHRSVALQKLKATWAP